MAPTKQNLSLKFGSNLGIALAGNQRDCTYKWTGRESVQKLLDARMLKKEKLHRRS